MTTKRSRARFSRPVEARIVAPTSDELDRLVTEICRWMNARSPSLSVDSLLAQPLDAMRMGIEVGERLGLVEETTAIASLARIGAWDASLIMLVNGICRAAMNGRKRGCIKPVTPNRKEWKRYAANVHA
jgi:hypothetical protein